jgi:hypothetical protein
MKKLKTEIVGVDRIAQVFGISERSVQKLVIEEEMPRISRGEYDLLKCCQWYMRYLHSQVCGCLGPCNGFDPETRAETNRRAERKKVLKEIAEDVVPELVGKKADTIKAILVKAIDEAYESQPGAFYAGFIESNRKCP